MRRGDVDFDQVQNNGGNVLSLKNVRAHAIDFGGAFADNRALIFEGGRGVIREVADTIAAMN
ncbi:hypothetical protein FIL92_00265 [SAR202 cluster bacterium AD-812-D07_MRT_10900m]|nr:hypothetical protein [SAR202 cluster bacterium AD-812-D07_MRT_10900m]